jgi:AcrR family transcriptional regulator
MSFARITVKLIVERAMVNKGTFYRHYLDKYDLAEKAAARQLGELTAGLAAS